MGRVRGTFQEWLCALASFVCARQSVRETACKTALFGMEVFVCVAVFVVCVCECVWVCVCVLWVFMAFLSSRFVPLFSYCLLQAVKIHIEDHSVSSRVIFCMEGWMEGWMTEWVGAIKRSQGEGVGGGGNAATVGGAPLKIPIEWLINQKALKAS